MKTRLALVTGGARGIGKACAKRLLELNYRVVLFDINDEAARQFLDEEESRRLFYYRCDASDYADVKEKSVRVSARHGTVSVLVNNAGIQTHCPFLEMSEEIWDRTLEVNLKSVFNLCKCLAPGMVEQGFGRIINIASVSARRGSAKHTHYCASKAAVLGFTRALSMEIARCGVTVNAVCPGIIDTNMVQETLALKRDIWLEQMHVKRLGTPEDIANAVAFLVGDASDWITGQALDVNGGLLTP